MRRWMIVSTALCVCLLACTWPARLAAQKIGYVSTDAIATRYEANVQAQTRLNTMVDEWKAEIAQQQRDIDELELEMKKNRLIWSDTERQQKEKELEDKRKERDRFAREKLEPGGDYDKQAEQLFKSVWDKIYSAVQKVAAAEGYDMVWDKSTQPLVYVNAKFDITTKVMKELGIDAEDMERKQKDIIDADPRNKRQEEPRKRKTRRGSEPQPDSTLTPIDVPPLFPTGDVRMPSTPAELPRSNPDSIPPKKDDEVPR
ncbi:MAG: OmpH family outer membrane protein [bacterium]|nr:OmpH family outer membrane protein [bacterium]